MFFRKTKLSFSIFLSAADGAFSQLDLCSFLSALKKTNRRPCRRGLCLPGRLRCPRPHHGRGRDGGARAGAQRVSGKWLIVSFFFFFGAVSSLSTLSFLRPPPSLSLSFSFSLSFSLFLFLFLSLFLFLTLFLFPTHACTLSALLYCMEHLEDSLEDWLGEELSAFGDDDYLLFDCPGQVELYSHVSCFRSLADYLASHDVRACAVYCLDVQFAASPSKYVAGCLAALAAMVCLEMPHVNVLTKVDLLPKEGKSALRRYLVPDANELSRDLAAASAFGAGGGGGAEGGSSAAAAAGPSSSNNGSHARRTRALDEAVVRLLDDWALVSFVPLDRSGAPLGGSDDEDDFGSGRGEGGAGGASSALGIERRAPRGADGEGDGFYTPGVDEGAGVAAVLAHIDHAIQFGEDADVKIAPDREEAEEGGGDE